MVFAEKDHFRTFLSQDSQMDQYLANGATLYITDGTHEEVLATPEDGFVRERPTLVRMGESNGKI